MDTADPLTLRASSGDARIDCILRGIVGIYETAFPGRVRGYYLTGSFADGSSVGISDLDLMLLFKGALSEAEKERARDLERHCGWLSPVRLDLWFVGETSLAREAVALKLGSLPVYGEDVRERLALPPLPIYTRDAMDFGQYFLRWVLRRAERLRFPLDYPDPGGAFYGYDTVRVPEWYPPGTTRGIKELVTSATRAATGLVALQAGRYAGTKSGGILAYRQSVGGEWADYLDELYASGKQRWRYSVPDAPDERERLRLLCARTLDFERHFFAVLRDMLLVSARSPDVEARVFAAERLAALLYTDDDTLATLRALRADSVARVRDAAEAALAARSRV